MSRAYLKRTEGDYGDILTFNLQNADGTASDLSSQTAVTLHGRLEGDSAARMSVAMAVIGGEIGGVVNYTILSTDPISTIPGLWYLEVEVTWADREVTWDVAVVTVEPEQA